MTSPSNELTVEVRAPSMVFLAGVLLPHGTYRVEPNPVAPNVCDVTVIRDAPHLPRVLRDIFAAIPPDAPDVPVELKGGRVFQSIPGPGGSALFVELGLRNLLLVRTPTAVPS